MHNFTNSEEIIKHLDLEKFPGKAGWFKLILHDMNEGCNECDKKCDQANSTTILHLFEGNSVSRWCRINSTLVWSFLAGDVLDVTINCPKKGKKTYLLGNEFLNNQHPILIIPKNCWAKISTKGEWALASFLCTPGFEFESLEIAEEDWSPA